MAEPASPPRLVVLDSNVVLDLLVFDDPCVRALRASIEGGATQWLATSAMRDELARVLGYPNLAAWLARRALEPREVACAALDRFDRSAQRVAPAVAAPLACSDPDDQMFIDLAFAHGAELLSRDRAVLDVWRRINRPSRPTP